MKKRKVSEYLKNKFKSPWRENKINIKEILGTNIPDHKEIKEITKGVLNNKRMSKRNNG